MYYYYAKFGTDLSFRDAPVNDLDGAITGKCILNLKAWFDENPDERMRLGWIKIIKQSENDIVYDKQKQFLIETYKKIDDYTIESTLEVFDKSEEMLMLEDINEGVNYFSNEFDVMRIGNIVFSRGRGDFQWNQ